MKKTMIMSLLAIMVIAWACDKGGGSEEVAPAEVKPVKVPKDSIKTEIIIPRPNCKDSSQVAIKFLYEDNSIPKCAYYDSTVKDGTYDSGTHKSHIINTDEAYRKLVNYCPKLDNGQTASLPMVDFEKYSLLTGVVSCPNPAKVRNIKLVKYCDDYILTIEFVLGAAAVETTQNYFALVPKIPSNSIIKYKIYQRFF